MPKKGSGKKPYIFAVGRRREAVARVRLYNTTTGLVDVFENPLKKGDIVVNGKPANAYFKFSAYAPLYQKFLKLTNIDGKYIFTARVVGGGIAGQLDAVILGMARTLDKMDREAYHKVLKDNGYLTRDPRARERRKVGNAGKARRKKSSPKR
jgi:small subunit ribosomal protein S9